MTTFQTFLFPEIETGVCAYGAQYDLHCVFWFLLWAVGDELCGIETQNH